MAGQDQTGARTQELRFAQWSEFDFDNAVWTIPPEHMKMKCIHLVPLSSQVISLLKTLRAGGRLSYQHWLHRYIRRLRQCEFPARLL
ncbi:tyrosine-type recombinase/integrase [Salmonella enterica]|nr:tyrosine-type recombinase/integrase [Salmonella enterica]EEH5466530.1 tyrosine-type recombinase/integrase [Salmonella enterica]EEH7556073.1 tyrosine-type recombinase/integrase [Salmonella enterica]EEO5640230.1 tyrosine-type recombinase/integrase [Salmonella enterica]EEQ0204519.1 tyrosine-type recombinase/integrase [Salmonella enterica]